MCLIFPIKNYLLKARLFFLDQEKSSPIKQNVLLHRRTKSLKIAEKKLVWLFFFHFFIFTSQVDQMSHIPGNIRESDTNGIIETNLETLS